MHIWRYWRIYIFRPHYNYEEVVFKDLSTIAGLALSKNTPVSIMWDLQLVSQNKMAILWKEFIIISMKFR
jgi:hypothetical protein